MPHTLPLNDHADVFRQKFGKDFTLHKSFARRKTLIVDNGLNYDDLKGALALLTGGVGRTVDGKDFLDLDPAVDAWRRRYEQADRDAERVARQEIERNVRKEVESTFSFLDDPANAHGEAGFESDQDLSLLLRAIEPKIVARYAAWFAAQLSADEDESDDEASFPLDIARLRSLPLGQKMLESALSPELTETVALVFLQSDVVIRLTGQGRSTDYSGLGFTFSPPGAAALNAKREQFTRQRMAALLVPPGALLGFERLAPAVRISPELAERTVRHTTPGTARTEVLTELARQCGLSVLADSYTLPDLLDRPPASVGELLRAASQAFGTVCRQDGQTLVARRVSWPIDDLAEPPWPYPERWLEQKTRVLEAKRQPTIRLYLGKLLPHQLLPTFERRDLAALLSLTPRQRGRLQWAVNKAMPPISVAAEALVVGKNSVLIREFVTMPGDAWRQLMDGRAIPFRQLSRDAQEVLRRKRGDSVLERGLRLLPPVPNAPGPPHEQMGGRGEWFDAPPDWMRRLPMLMLTPTRNDPENREPLLELPIRWPPR